MLHALRWQGTFYGDVLRIGSFVAFFLAFHLMVAMYCGRKLALLAATFVVGSFVLRWDGNLLTTYPLMTFPSATVFCAAAMFGRLYVASSAPWSLAVAGVLLFLSLFSNEGATLLFGVLFGLTIIANDRQLPKRCAVRWYERCNPRTFGLATAFIGSVTLYGVVAVAWSVTHPSTYAGFVFGSFHPGRFGEVLLSFATGNSILAYLGRQYVVFFSDLGGLPGTRATYDLAQAFGTMPLEPLAVLVGVIAAALFFRLSIAIRKDSADPDRASDGAIWAIAFGVAVAVLPVLPVALSAQRQSWYFDYGQTYALTALSHFGLCLAIAGAIAAVIRMFTEPVAIKLALLSPVVAGALAAMAYNISDRIAIDMRPEAGESDGGLPSCCWTRCWKARTRANRSTSLAVASS
jgi:hypothetical protein